MRGLRILGGIVLLLASECARQGETDPAGALRAEAIWRHHEEAVERALSGVSKDEEFAEACLFFQRLTNIDLHGDGTFIGWIPTQQTKRDLIRLRAWHRANGKRIYWDPASKSVKVRPPP